MSETGFTKGPWLRDGRTVYALDETGSCNRFSVRVEGGWSFRSAGTLGSSGDRTTDAELEAVAALIRAAPTLYTELVRLRAYIASPLCLSNAEKEADRRHLLVADADAALTLAREGITQGETE